MVSSLAVSALRLPARVAVGAAPGFMDQRWLRVLTGGDGWSTPDASGEVRYGFSLRSAVKPMGRRLGVGGCMSWRMAERMAAMASS